METSAKICTIDSTSLVLTFPGDERGGDGGDRKGDGASGTPEQGAERRGDESERADERERGVGEGVAGAGGDLGRF